MIRPRRSADLERCLELLHAVHLADQYPVRWPQDPPRWLTGRAGPAACVSENAGALETRRRGVGSALMDAAESYCADHGLRLVLDVADHNEGAITFYERRGWRRVGTTSLLLGDDRTTLPLVVFVLG